MGAQLHKMSKYRPSIFQGRLDLFYTTRSVSLTREHPAERTFFRVLIASLLLIACTYIYFVGASVSGAGSEYCALALLRYSAP